MLDWKSEAQVLPKVGQSVMLASPHQDGDYWDICIANLHVTHEGVVPAPVAAGSEWPTNYYWVRSHNSRDAVFVTGNSWWASLADISLPPGAVHDTSNGYHNVRQSGAVHISPAPKIEECGIAMQPPGVASKGEIAQISDKASQTSCSDSEEIIMCSQVMKTPAVKDALSNFVRVKDAYESVHQKYHAGSAAVTREDFDHSEADFRKSMRKLAELTYLYTVLLRHPTFATAHAYCLEIDCSKN